MQLIFILTYNAIKYTANGTICLTINVKRKENQHYLKLKIEDTGIGMDALF